MKVVMERLTYSTYCSMIRSVFEKDKFIFSLLLALEVGTGTNHQICTLLNSHVEV